MGVVRAEQLARRSLPVASACKWQLYQHVPGAGSALQATQMTIPANCRWADTSSTRRACLDGRAPVVLQTAATMHLVALVSARALSRVRVALGREHHVSHAAGWPELSAIVLRLPVSLVVVNPHLADPGSIDELRELRRDFPSLPVLLHLPMSAPAMQSLAELAHEGFRNVVIEDYEDDAAFLRAQVLSLVNLKLEERALALLEPALRKAPGVVASALSHLFREPHAFGSVDDLARAAGMPRRTFDRHLHALGLAPGHKLLTGARLLRVYQYSRDPGYSLAHIAEKVGYSDPVVLARQIRAVTGETPTAWRRHASAEDTIDRLSALLLAGGSDRSSGPPRTDQPQQSDSQHPEL